MFSVLQQLFSSRDERDRMRKRKVLMREAKKAARETASILQDKQVEPDGVALVKGSHRSYWLVTTELRFRDNSPRYTRLYDDGTVLLCNIPGGRRELRTSQLEQLPRNIRSLVENN